MSAAVLTGGLAGLVVVAVGRRLVGRSAVRPRVRGVAAGRRDRPAGGPVTRGGAAFAAAAALSLALAAGAGAVVAVVVLAVAGRAWHHRRRRRAAQAGRAAAVPDLVDLFVLAASAGHPVPAALVAVAPRSPPPLRPAVCEAERQLGRGSPVADVLEALGGALGPAGEPLTDALADAAARGTPLVDALQAVAAGARQARTRGAEEAARRLPVTLLFPLACCVLPAAVLLAVVPVLAGSLRSLSP